MNAANEEAVSYFLQEKIAFSDIAVLVDEIVKQYPNNATFNFSEIDKANHLAREMVRNKII